VKYILVVGQQSPEQLAETRKALELVQSLEREKQQLQFQCEEFKLKINQAKASQDMEKELILKLLQLNHPIKAVDQLSWLLGNGMFEAAIVVIK